jgi:hypothetical protein
MNLHLNLDANPFMMRNIPSGQLLVWVKCNKGPGLDPIIMLTNVRHPRLFQYFGHYPFCCTTRPLLEVNQSELSISKQLDPARLLQTVLKSHQVAKSLDKVN